MASAHGHVAAIFRCFWATAKADATTGVPLALRSTVVYVGPVREQ
jgi:hypothetical protein